MIREKLINEITKNVATEFRFSDLTEIIDSGAVEFVVDEMLLKFESRTCENCAYSTESDDGYDYYCIKHNEYENCYMSCNKWEHRDD